MKRVAKKITLKEDTLRDIQDNNIDVEAFINRINGYLADANYLIQNKMIDMNGVHLYQSLGKVFDIHFEPNDYKKMLSAKYDKHYTKLMTLNTNMYDSNDYTVSYLCAATNKVGYNDNDTISLDNIRKLTDSYDLLLLCPKFVKKENPPVKKEKYESHLFDLVEVDKSIIKEDDEMYPYACDLLQKEMIVKYVLYDLKLYVDEVLHQVRYITGLSLIKDNDVLANIGKQYKRAYDLATNDRVIPKKERIAVRYHQKTKNRKYR